MKPPGILEVICDQCKVQTYCPRRGSSPLILGTKHIRCRIIGGYGRKPVDQEILSEASKKLAEQSGPCLTIAEVPEKDEASGYVKYDVTKIFHPAITHERENVSWQIKMMVPNAYDPQK